MKLREKVIVGYIVTSLAFLALTYAVFYLVGTPAFLQPLSTYAYTAFLTWGAILSLIWVGLLYVFVIKRLETIDHTIFTINRGSAFSERLEIKGDDEIASLSEELNKILELAEASNDRLELRIHARTIKLEKRIDLLEREASNHEYVKKNLLTHNENLIRMSRYDALTNLPNRILFNETVSQTINSAKLLKKVAALLIINFENFKNINETLGHATGDLVLKEMAKRLKAMVREVDMLARLGGAEFGILLSDIVHSEFANVVSEKIISVTSEPIKIGSTIIHASVNIGIALAPQDGYSLEPLLKNADAALYKAKSMGKGIFQFFTKEMGLQATKLNKFEGALQSALKNNEFLLNYQPILNLQESKIVGVEALVRWESPVLGLMKPGRFIPLAEETGFIMQLGEWILREACKQNKAWQEKGFQPIPISVNLSPDQFTHQDLVHLVKTILEETKLNPAYLELEIKSSTIMDNIENSTRILKALTETGVKIVIDEFGSGTTSISFLKQLSVHTLKIDQNFINNIPEDQHNAEITKTVIALAHSLGLKTIATGVETNEQLNYLTTQHCDLGQGYLFSKPLSENNFVSSYFVSNSAAAVVSADQK